MYMYYYRQARKLREETGEDLGNRERDIDHADGALSGISAIFLQMYGPRESYNLWQVTAAACDRAERIGEAAV